MGCTCLECQQLNGFNLEEIRKIKHKDLTPGMSYRESVHTEHKRRATRTFSRCRE